MEETEPETVTANAQDAPALLVEKSTLSCSESEPVENDEVTHQNEAGVDETANAENGYTSS